MIRVSINPLLYFYCLYRRSYYHFKWFNSVRLVDQYNSGFELIGYTPTAPPASTSCDYLDNHSYLYIPTSPRRRVPSVKISKKHDQMLNDKLDEIENDVGVRGTKKSLVESAIESEYGDS